MGGGLDRCRREGTVRDKPQGRCRRELLPMNFTSVTASLDDSLQRNKPWDQFNTRNRFDLLTSDPWERVGLL